VWVRTSGSESRGSNRVLSRHYLSAIDERDVIERGVEADSCDMGVDELLNLFSSPCIARVQSLAPADGSMRRGALSQSNATARVE
jgi:hypothetical protein